MKAYRERWPLGTTQRLALEILLWTGLRRGDLARLGHQHIRDGVISMKTEKKSRRHAEGVQLDIPVFKDLRDAIDAMPVKTLSLITGARGEKITKETLGNYFADWCRGCRRGVPAPTVSVSSPPRWPQRAMRARRNCRLISGGSRTHRAPATQNEPTECALQDQPERSSQANTIPSPLRRCGNLQKSPFQIKRLSMRKREWWAILDSNQ